MRWGGGGGKIVCGSSQDPAEGGQQECMKMSPAEKIN